MTKSDHSAPEIVIVRRRVVDDMTAGKGGAWKIAYADFVTAMMAFFLVMWLINASNEETRAQVASYFNPIKLTDSRTGPRSLQDTETNQSSPATPSHVQGTPPTPSDVKSESALMSNPPKLLDRLANTLQKTVDEKGSIKADHTAGSRYSAAPEPGLGDPFDPQSWKTEADNDVMPIHSTRSSDVKSIHKSNRNEVNMSGEQIPRSDRSLGQLEGIKRQSASEQDKVDTSFDTDKQQSIKPLPVKHSEVDDLLKDIARELGTAPTDLSRWLEITQSPDGLLISLTESADFEMFKTGSAEPEPDMLRLVTAVAKAINSRPGKIFIRGHTDSRPFRNKYFDNWQLSTARAHIARHMLIRAGLDDERISRIEGVADREPRTPSDPFAPENRRIELLISRN